MGECLILGRTINITGSPWWMEKIQNRSLCNEGPPSQNDFEFSPFSPIAAAMSFFRLLMLKIFLVRIVKYSHLIKIQH